ncbi:MAG: hypothetical protein WAU65_01835 [Candidatus Nanoarchaeia archaeon]
MRKIISKYEKDKKKKRNQFLISIILIGVMLISVLGYAFQNYLTGNNNVSNINSTQSISYNGINFLNQNGFWYSNYNGNTLVFTYNPSQISSQDLTNITKTLGDFSNKILYIYSDDSNAESEVRSNLYSFNTSIIDACPAGMQCNQTIAQNINCSNNFIIINSGQQSVMQVQNCIYIYGQGQDLIKTVDNVLFKIFGIRQ